MIAEELERLQNLRDSGTLTEAEFQQAKLQILDGGWSGPAGFGRGAGVSGRICGVMPNTWYMLMHLSQLLTLAGGLGIVIPLVMWAVSKDDHPAANRHGLAIINWIISQLIYALVGGALCFIVIGFPIVIALAIATVAFPIVGAIKANSGRLWHYPLTITFFDGADESN